MSARIVLATIISEMSRSACPLVLTAIAETSQKKLSPSCATLDRVRRDLFGPIDHSAAQALAENELNMQSLVDSERWGFDFKLEIPQSSANSRYEWQLLNAQDVVPKPYALKSMPYLGARLSVPNAHHVSCAHNLVRTAPDISSAKKISLSSLSSLFISEKIELSKARFPCCGQHESDSGSIKKIQHNMKSNSHTTRKSTLKLISSRNQQPPITDFMKIRKRTKGKSPKNVLVAKEKISRKVSRIRD